MKPSFWYCDMYHMNFYYCLGWKRSDFTNYVKKAFDYDCTVAAGKTLMVQGENHSIIVIWVSKKTDYSVLAHECLHAANMTLAHIGWKPNLNNDEPQADLLSQIFTNAIKTKKGTK